MVDSLSFSQDNNHAGPSKLRSGSSGLTLVLPSLKNLKAAKGAKKSALRFGSISSANDVVSQEKKIPRPVKLKPLKEVLAKLISQIKKKDDYAFFLTPVDASQVPGYSDVVKRPMDLGTMTDKVHKGKYRSLEDFASDFRLVMTNAMIYNPPGTIYYSEAERIQAWGLDHIAKVAPTVIQYETDWNIEIEKDDDEGTVNVDEEEDDTLATPMDVDDQSRDRSVSVVSQTQQGTARRGPRGPYKKQGNTQQSNTVSESIDGEGRLPGSKDGLGAFPPMSDWAEKMVALKLKGKKYRTKRERLRIEREGPPYLADGSLDYSEMEDPFLTLSALVPDPLTRPSLTPLYPPLHIPTQPEFQPQSGTSTPLLSIPQQQPPSFLGAINVPLSHDQPNLSANLPNTSGKRRHWTIVRQSAGRNKGKEKDEEQDVPDLPSWQVSREAHTCDFGSFALLAGELAEEMRRRGNAVNGQPKEEDEETSALDLIRESLGCDPSRRIPQCEDDKLKSDTASGISLYNNGYWTSERAAEAEEYIRDVVYGGIDGLAYIRSLAEFVSSPQKESDSTPNYQGLGMTLAEWVLENVVDPLTGGRHSLLRETAHQLMMQSDHKNSGIHYSSTSDSVRNQVFSSLNVYPPAAAALSALNQIRTHKIDMGALIKTPQELFISEEEWAGKGLKAKWKLKMEPKSDINGSPDGMEVEEPEQTWMDVDASINGAHINGNQSPHGAEGPEQLNDVLDYVADVITKLDRSIRNTRLSLKPSKEPKIEMDTPTSSGEDAQTTQQHEDPTMRNLRLNLLALAKRAPLDTIARLPKDLVPEHIRHFVPTLGNN